MSDSIPTDGTDPDDDLDSPFSGEEGSSAPTDVDADTDGPVTEEMLESLGYDERASVATDADGTDAELQGDPEDDSAS